MECKYLLVGWSLLLGALAGGPFFDSYPPAMITRDFDISYVKPGSQAVQRCQADGDPAPTYVWKKDGIALSNDSYYEINPIRGFIKIRKVTVENSEGLYQCSAQNSLGTAVSGFWEVIVAKISGFEGNKQQINVSLNEYSYYKIPCQNQPPCTPATTVYWRAGEEHNFVPTSTEERERIVIDDEGSLHFLLVRASDILSKPYICGLFNRFLSIKAESNEQFNLTVLRGPEVTSKPILRYSKSVEATIGSKTTLLCIFSGNPIPQVHWFKDDVRLPDGSILSDGTPRYIIDLDDTTGRKLIISKLNVTDDGYYICRATNQFGINKGTVQVMVKGPPQWKKESLKSTRVPFGGTAKFHCDTVSYYATNSLPMWMKNGEPLIGCGVKKLWCGSLTDCYDHSMKCDNTSNCPSIPSTDEWNCSAQEKCIDGMFSCGGGKCQTAASVIPCDGISQCLNGGDESVRYCGCKAMSDFMCADLQKCIPASELCNKIANCIDGSDERNCAYDPEKVIDNKFYFSADLRQLTIPNVSWTDTMCIQCLVYNFRQYGSNPKPDIVGVTFGNAYLLVIEPITISSDLPEKLKVQPGDIINLTISAKTDYWEQNNLRYDWYIGGAKYPDQFPWVIWSKIIELSMGNTHIVINTSAITSRADMRFQKLMGNLTVRVYHEFDQKTISTEIFTDRILKTPAPKGGFNLWLLLSE